MTRGLFWVRACLLPLAAVAAGLVWHEVRLARSAAPGPPAPAVAAGDREIVLPAPPELPLEAYARRITPDVFAYGLEPRAGGGVGDEGADAVAAAGLRLAGTFMAYGGGRSGIDRLAVVEVADGAGQQIVTVGDDLDGGEVADISRDRLLLRYPDGSSRFLTAFEEGAQRPSSGPAPPAPESWAEVDPATLVYPVSPFRRVINRDAVLALQEKVLRDPAEVARLLALAQPVDGDRGLEGFRIGSLGEDKDPLIAAFGLRPGDMVRKINSVEMSSRDRAEYFYREFMRDELTALVLEVDRGGLVTNLIYSVR